MYAERTSPLTGAVVWTKAPVADAAAARPVLPDGCMDLLWDEERLLVAGPDTGPYAPEGPARRWAGVRFRPGTAPVLLGVPAHELLDRRVELADLWSAARVRRLRDRVAAAGDPATALEGVALDLATAAGPPDPWVHRLVRRLDEGRPVAATAAELGLGARTLHRRCLGAFGYGPKTLARVLRLRRALALARAGVPHAETAIRAGYADQPHLAREVRRLAGRSLGAFLSDQVAPADGPRPPTRSEREDPEDLLAGR
ncbi:helix-turn-helix domain-containing protein [Streptomyces sp. NPDC048106]|uniref:helix-turn-helix domain-containing protein n=1 Tax=Streptomyces sp. NPDC048106 TaxID=3155750 RepID=UPI003453376D